MNSLRLNVSVEKPRKTIVPLAIGLAWGEDPEFLYQEKLDGRFETRRVRGKKDVNCPQRLGETILAGEYVRVEFYAFDLLQWRGEDCRDWPLSARLLQLDQVFYEQPIDVTGGEVRRVPSSRQGGVLLAEVLARGGEGVVRKALAGKWGEPMEACKRLETFYCVVTAINAGQSVMISKLAAAPISDLPSSISAFPSPAPASPCGAVALKGGKCDRIRVGSLLKIEGFGLTAAGQIREPRPCKDTPESWLVKY